MKNRKQGKAHREKRFRTLTERKAASKYGNFLADQISGPNSPYRKPRAK